MGDVSRIKAKRNVFFVLNILLSLVIGLTVYVFCRPDTHVSKIVHNLLGVSPEVVLPEWVMSFLRNYMADVLWAYALTFTVIYILGSGFLTFAIVAIFEICIEVSQKVGIMSGTFDWVDIILEVCISALVMLLINTIQKEKYQ